MTRTDEIYNEIDAIRQQALPQLNSPSKTAEYKLWQWVFAAAQSLFETVISNDKAEMQAIVDANHLGTGPWYVELAKQFQWNNDEAYYLVVNPVTGVMTYNKVVPDDRIVTQSAYVEGNGRIIIKVAAGSAGNLHELTEQQQINFENYMRQLKIAGIIVEVVNLPADLLEIDCTVYYNPAYNNNQLKEAIIAALDKYGANFNYNGIVYKNAIIDAIQAVPGVVDVEIGKLYGLQGENRADIQRTYTTYSGYFNIKKTDSFPKITLIPE